METIKYDFEDKIPVIAETDFLVVGGGPGGFGAAVTAARLGVKTMLVEANGAMGGTAAFAEVTPFMPSHKCWFDENKKLICAKTLDTPLYPEWAKCMHGYLPEKQRVEADADLEMFTNPPRIISRELASLAMEDICLEAGVHLLFHHTLVGVKVENGHLRYAVFHSKSGFCAIRAKVFADSTGDGDLAAFAGCPFEYGDPEHGLCQPMTLCFKLSHVDMTRVPVDYCWGLYAAAKVAGKIRCPRENILKMEYYDDDIVHFNTTRVVKKSAISGIELSEAEIEARHQMREIVRWLRNEVPGFENCCYHSIAPRIGIRESRRISGRAYLTKDNYLAASKFPDAVARCAYAIDIHSVTGAGTKRVRLPSGEFYEIPYGCIVPCNVENLLIAARCISVDHAVHSSMRVMATVVSVGQAAGAAACLSLKSGLDVSALDGRNVREKLVAFGARLREDEFDGCEPEH